MEQKIINSLESMVNYLQMVKEEVKNGTPERIDSLDLLSLVSIGLDATYKEIKEHFNIEEE